MIVGTFCTFLWFSHIYIQSIHHIPTIYLQGVKESEKKGKDHGNRWNVGSALLNQTKVSCSDSGQLDASRKPTNKRVMATTFLCSMMPVTGTHMSTVSEHGSAI